MLGTVSQDRLSPLKLFPRTHGPRTSSPPGQLVLGPSVPLGQLVLGQGVPLRTSCPTHTGPGAPLRTSCPPTLYNETEIILYCTIICSCFTQRGTISVLLGACGWGGGHAVLGPAVPPWTAHAQTSLQLLHHSVS